MAFSLREKIFIQIEKVSYKKLREGLKNREGLKKVTVPAIFTPSSKSVLQAFWIKGSATHHIPTQKKNIG